MAEGIDFALLLIIPINHPWLCLNWLMAFDFRGVFPPRETSGAWEKLRPGSRLGHFG